MTNKKKVLIAHYNGSWFDEPSKIGYEDQIKWITEFLQKEDVEVTRIETIPSDEEVMEFDGIVFVSLSFKKDAGELKRKTGKKVFMVTGLPEREDDRLGFVPISKSIGWHEIASIISKCLDPSSNILIRTALNSVANKSEMNWHPLDEDMREPIEAFLEKNPDRKAEMERGGVVIINRIGIPSSQEIRFI